MKLLLKVLMLFLGFIFIVLFIGMAEFTNNVWALSIFLLPILLVIFLLKKIFSR
ncbi:hypothetical protein ACFWMS_25765 [Peribacillus butanolivorans]|uniref:hypothetical protein n=1 Tax=Peribacillus butanolivorans TaxID=421767 RepID=UPI00365D8B32